MSSNLKHEYTAINTNQALLTFYEQHKNVEWIGFDTEFVGEKRFFTKLCLIQIASPLGLFLIDPLSIDDLSPLLDLLAHPDVLKITHAGENDYRLLYHQYDFTPRNIFDTQIAAGFIGYRYPLSFGKLVESELGRRISKSYTVADWETRPLNPKQLKYALNDVIPLHPLWSKLQAKLQKRGRLAWVKEECSKLEHRDYYRKDPNAEAINSSLMKTLKLKEKVFLLRLFQWRIGLAREKDYSKEMILPQKMIGHIVRSISSGPEALHHNRRITPKVARKYGSLFKELYDAPMTDEEKQVLSQIVTVEQEEPAMDFILEMLFLLIKHRCYYSGVSTSLVIQRNALKRLLRKPETLPEELGEKWKKEILGEDLVNWLGQIEHLEITFEKGQAILRLKS